MPALLFVLHICGVVLAIVKKFGINPRNFLFIFLADAILIRSILAKNKGASPVDRSVVPEGNTQIFAISEDAAGSQKEDLAWASYVLLQNTNTISVV